MRITTNVDMRYFVLDHLGSVVAMSDASANVTRQYYDPWGAMRNGDGTPDGACALPGASPSTRGFTNQEQMPGVCLVNGNARLYDPVLGRFLAADPTVEAPALSQDWNRYSYVVNNPLAFSDPSGLCFLGCFWHSSAFRAVVAVVATVFLEEFALPLLEGGMTIFAAGSVNAVMQSVGAWAVANVFASAAAGGFIQSGSAEGALMAGMQATTTASFGLPLDHMAGDAILTHATSFVIHGMIGGIFAIGQKGGFLGGFMAGGVETLADPWVDENDPHAEPGYEPGVFEHAALGGIGAVLGGGKFANGAVTGAFGYLFNEELKKNSSLLGDMWDELKWDIRYEYDEVSQDLSHLYGENPWDALSDISSLAPGLIPEGAVFSSMRGGTATVDTVDSEFQLTNTVEQSALNPKTGELVRPFVNSPLTIKEIEATGTGVPDPGGFPGALRYDVPGNFDGSSGTWQLVIDPRTNTVLHYNFVGK